MRNADVYGLPLRLREKAVGEGNYPRGSGRFVPHMLQYELLRTTYTVFNLVGETHGRWVGAVGWSRNGYIHFHLRTTFTDDVNLNAHTDNRDCALGHAEVLTSTVFSTVGGIIEKVGLSVE